jgi:prephenate dehydrogenase
MADILLTNRPAILERLHAFGQSLTGLAALLEQGDEETLKRWLAGRQAEYDLYRQHKP